MNILNDKKGLSIIEVIISIIILSILATSFSLLFSISLDTPVIYNKEKAYQYAKMEMEKLYNKPYKDIVSIPKTNFPIDTNYDYEIIVNELNYDLKEVWINFYLNGSNRKISELYTTFFKLEKVKICDDFEVNGYNSPPWNWSVSPTNQWSVLNVGGTHQYVLAYRRRAIGFAYTNDYIGSNYILSSDIYIS
ncbi:MAG: prepilin-type N-terminal cleavage/methylation domain-containing protein, partial [Caldisericia bacterium]